MKKLAALLAGMENRDIIIANRSIDLNDVKAPVRFTANRELAIARAMVLVSALEFISLFRLK